MMSTKPPPPSKSVDDDEELVFTKRNLGKRLEKFAGPVFNFVLDVSPAVIKACEKGYAIYKSLPLEYVKLVFGALLCFFGGFYPTVFAALQAAEHGGLSTVGNALSALSDEVLVIVAENKKDNKVDDDGDGIPDAQEVEGREFIKRKIKLVLAKVNPVKVNDAIASIYKVWMSVLAVLTIEFARTITLSLTITKFVEKMVNRLVLPVVKAATPKEYQKWCPIVLGWWCQSIGISIAWKIQTVISALTSALAGGLIVARTVMLIRSKGTKNPDDTYLDEVVAYILAFVGFYFQYNHSFAVPFPFNVLLFPVKIAETYIRWAVTSAASG